MTGKLIQIVLETVVSEHIASKPPRADAIASGLVSSCAQPPLIYRICSSCFGLKTVI